MNKILTFVALIDSKRNLSDCQPGSQGLFKARTHKMMLLRFRECACRTEASDSAYPDEDRTDEAEAVKHCDRLSADRPPSQTSPRSDMLKLTPKADESTEAAWDPHFPNPIPKT